MEERRQPGRDRGELNKPSWLKRLDRSGVPLLLARVFVGGWFVYHGFLKVGDPVDFLKVLREYELLPLDPPHIINGLAVTLPWIEVVGGLALLLGVALRSAAVLMIVMLGAFTAAVLLRASGVQSDTGQSFCETFDLRLNASSHEVPRKDVWDASTITEFGHSGRDTRQPGHV